MDIQQLRSWIFELYTPLDDERQYIVFDAVRGNLLIDIPPFSERALRLIQGAGRASLLLATNAARAAEAHRYRELLGIQIAVHQDDAAAVTGGADLVLRPDDLVRPDTRVFRVKGNGQGATVVLVRKSGGVLFSGDLDLASDGAKQLIPLSFSSVLSSKRAPIWNAGRDVVLQLQSELPRQRKQFGILLPPPWDRAYKGRLEDKMYHHDVIVPKEDTAAREAAMGPATLVVASATREIVEKAKRPVPGRSVIAGDGAGASSAPPAPPREPRARPKPFAEDWRATSTERPPTTIANPAADIVPAATGFKPRSIGDRFRRLPIEDLVGSPYVDYVWGGIDLAPDGTEVAFSWNRTGTFEVYSAPIERERLYQLTDANERSVWPRWSPDAKQIAFLRDRGGNERFDIWLVDRDGETERNLSNEPEITHRDIAWSPDGSRIAYVANAGAKDFAVHVIDVATGKKRALTEGEFEDALPRWSPDGKRLLFSSRRDAVRTNNDLFVISAEGGTPTKLVTRDVDGESFEGDWSRDGTRIAFTTNTRRRYEIAVATLDGDTVTRVEPLTKSIFDETAPAWRPDGRAVLYLHNEDAEVSVRRVFVVSHADHAVSDRPGVHHAHRVGPDGDLVAYLFTGAREPWDVYVTRERMTEPRRLTRSLPATVDPETLVEPVHVRYPGAMGREIPALLYIPYAEALRGDGSPPVIVHVHGGPTSQHFRWWDRASQWFANSGYVVLAPNVRGSTGYGREFQEGNRRDWGGQDLEDVVKGIDWLAKQRIADTKRVGIYGGSYGGYMTLMALAKYPDRFAAGVSVVGVVSWKSFYDTTRGDLREYLVREFGDPKTDAERYLDRSPLTHVSKIEAPLLVLQGENDPRVPLTEAEQVVAALRSAGKMHEYYVYKGEGHGFRTRENLIDSVRRAGEWFDRYLLRA
ncbi:MAG TPA: alpha/beta fold hydrolase [Candidatus Limnocylindria bacterium]|jgi:dipeptidyl aminopeptidase/acylaminoacyl peptidase|nr:alpha/beta fold hydrolase [Candidatus Limnocylindria bacterium]